MSEECVYIFNYYPFYEGSIMVMISKNYDTVKKEFDKVDIKDQKNRGYGYVIKQYEYDKKYSCCGGGEAIDWIEIDYDGNVKDLMRV